MRTTALLSLCGALVACAANPPPKQARSAGPVVKKSSTSDQRREVGITVYNQNFGLVREIRDVDVGTGRVELEFRDVSANIQPETVHIRSLDGADALTVLEQDYRYDLLSPQKLLEKYVGKNVKVYRYNEKLGTDEKLDAEVLSVEGGSTVLRINGEVTYNFPGRIAFPEVPPNLIAKPTLVWLLASDKPKQRVEVTYLTQNLNWQADYVLVIDPTDTRGDLTGWVTLSNTSGASYEHAQLKLVAGDVQRLRPPAYPEEDMPASTAAPMGGAAPQFREEGFFEYHLYTLQRATDLLDKENKQVTLLEGHDIRIDKRLIFFGAQGYYRGSYGQIASNQKVGVYLDIQNKKDNHLGIPLPKGTVRVYKADKSGAAQFIGEDAIDHTPRDEKIRVKMGDAFDVVGDRKQMAWTALGACTSESDWEISLRNHKDTPVEVEDREPVGGDWEIISSSQPAHREDANTFTFTVKIPANGETKITYKVRVKWC